MQLDVMTSPTPAPTATTTAVRHFRDGSSSSTSSIFPGASDYPVFPNAVYLSRFYLPSSQVSGLTDLDRHLYNVCYLPYRPFEVGRSSSIDKRRVTPSDAPRPSYLIDEAPCKRQASINANCYFKNTNGTFSGLEPYMDAFDEQQYCYCKKYPFFDSAAGCMKCFEKHGGIEGYHWFPQSYVKAAEGAYCGAGIPNSEFYQFMQNWAKTDPAASVSSTTASTALSTQTDASLYYTYAAAATTSAKNVALPGKTTSLGGVLFALLAASAILCL